MDDEMLDREMLDSDMLDGEKLSARLRQKGFKILRDAAARHGHTPTQATASSKRQKGKQQNYPQDIETQESQISSSPIELSLSLLLEV